MGTAFHALGSMRTAEAGENLISFAVVLEDGSERESAFVAELSRGVDGKFEFYEIICVTGQLDPAGARSLHERLSGIPNLRLLSIASDAEFDDLLAHALEAAIGDYVVAVGVADASVDDALGLIATCLSENVDVVRAVARPPAGRAARGRAALLRHVLRAIIGRPVNPLQRRAFCISRRALAKLAADRRRGRHLRLVQVGDMFAERELAVDGGPGRRGWREAWRRLRLIAQLAALRTPAFLTTVALVTLCCSLLSMLYGVYVLAIWAFKTEVAAGWVSLSLVTAFMSTIVFAVLCAICLGMTQLLKSLQTPFDQPPVKEFSTADLFSKSRRLNVEIELDQP